VPLTIYCYNQAGQLSIEEDMNALQNLPNDSVIWMDIESSDPELMNRVAETFHLHELAIEDCLTPGHYPKIEDYGQYLFMIFRSLIVPSNSEDDFHKIDDEIEEEENTRAVAIFLAKNFIISHRMREVSWLDAVGRQIKQIPERTIEAGSDAIAYRIIDVLIDRFTRGLNTFEDKIDALENMAIEQPDEFEIPFVNETKRELSTLRHIMRDQRVIITRLAQETSLIRERQLRRYFKDVEDHAIAIITTIDKQIEATVGVRDVYFAMANVRLGDIMRILAVITTVAVPMNLVVGMYGMNFDVIPLSHDPYGFWLIMAGMTLLAIGTLYLFKRNHWI